MKKVVYTSLWFFTANILIVAGLLWASFIHLDLAEVNAALAQQRQNIVLASETHDWEFYYEHYYDEFDPVNTLTTSAGTRDARAILVANFIDRNDRDNTSPLQPYDKWGQIFVDIADEYGIDFRLLPTIARKESNFCKSNIARTYYNCFGWGVPQTGITAVGKFDSFEEGMRTVARGLRVNYIDQGLTDPVSIMRRYCPPCFEGDGAWARNLNNWLAEMRYDDRLRGLESDVNVDLLEFV
ncbi:MAG: glucosaminidase domain-containing protein, partial [Pseudomonadales bacterium]|nr:glucosaminidase domain-containing protein [Pseudomonadales bacterium]